MTVCCCQCYVEYNNYLWSDGQRENKRKALTTLTTAIFTLPISKYKTAKGEAGSILDVRMIK